MSTYLAVLNGDDFYLVGYSSYLLPLLESDGVEPSIAETTMSRFGFDVKLTRTYDLHELEFCQMLFYPTRDGLVPGPKIGRLLTRLGWSIHPELDIYGVASGLSYITWHIPILREFVQRHIELTKPNPKVKNKLPYNYIEATSQHEPNAETFDFIMARYNLTLEEIRSLCALVASARLLTLLPSTTVAEMARVDGA